MPIPSVERSARMKVALSYLDKLSRRLLSVTHAWISRVGPDALCTLRAVVGDIIVPLTTGGMRIIVDVCTTTDGDIRANTISLETLGVPSPAGGPSVDLCRDGASLTDGLSDATSAAHQDAELSDTSDSGSDTGSDSGGCPGPSFGDGGPSTAPAARTKACGPWVTDEASSVSLRLWRCVKTGEYECHLRPRSLGGVSSEHVGSLAFPLSAEASDSSRLVFRLDPEGPRRSVLLQLGAYIEKTLLPRIYGEALAANWWIQRRYAESGELHEPLRVPTGTVAENANKLLRHHLYTKCEYPVPAAAVVRITQGVGVSLEHALVLLLGGKRTKPFAGALEILNSQFSTNLATHAAHAQTAARVEESQSLPQARGAGEAGALSPPTNALPHMTQCLRGFDGGIGTDEMVALFANSVAYSTLAGSTLPDCLQPVQSQGKDAAELRLVLTHILVVCRLMGRVWGRPPNGKGESKMNTTAFKKSLTSLCAISCLEAMGAGQHVPGEKKLRGILSPVSGAMTTSPSPACLVLLRYWVLGVTTNVAMALSVRDLEDGTIVDQLRVMHEVQAELLRSAGFTSIAPPAALRRRAPATPLAPLASPSATPASASVSESMPFDIHHRYEQCLLDPAFAASWVDALRSLKGFERAQARPGFLECLAALRSLVGDKFPRGLVGGAVAGAGPEPNGPRPALLTYSALMGAGKTMVPLAVAGWMERADPGVVWMIEPLTNLVCDLYERTTATGLAAVKLAGDGGVDTVSRQLFDTCLRGADSPRLRVVICTADKMIAGSSLRRYFDAFHKKGLLRLVVVDEADVVFAPSNNSRERRQNIIDALSAKMLPRTPSLQDKLPVLAMSGTMLPVDCDRVRSDLLGRTSGLRCHLQLDAVAGLGRVKFVVHAKQMPPRYSGVHRGTHAVQDHKLHPAFAQAASLVRTALDAYPSADADHSSPARAIVCCSSKREATEVARACAASGLHAADYHTGECVVGGNGGVDAAEANLEAFRLGRVRVLCTTTKLERGCDFENVVIVVHFNAPWSLRSFMQQTGRLTAMRTDIGGELRGPPPTSALLFCAQECKHILTRDEHSLCDGVAVLRYGLLKTQCRVTYLAAALGDEVPPEAISCSPGRRCDNCALRETKNFNMAVSDCRTYLVACRRVLQNEVDGRLTPKQLVTSLQKEYRGLVPNNMSSNTGAMCDLVYRWWGEGYLVGRCEQLFFASNRSKPELYVSPSTDFDDMIATNPSIDGVVWQPGVATGRETAQHKQIPGHVLEDFSDLDAALADASHADQSVRTLRELNPDPRKTRTSSSVGVCVDGLRALGFQVADVAVSESKHRRPGAHPRPVLRALAHASLLGVDTLDASYNAGSPGTGEARCVQQAELDDRMRLLAKATMLVFDAHSAFETRAFLEETMTSADTESLNLKREAYLELKDTVEKQLSMPLPEAVVRSWVMELDKSAGRLDEATSEALATCKPKWGKTCTLNTLCKMASWVTRRPVHLWTANDRQPQVRWRGVAAGSLRTSLHLSGQILHCPPTPT